MELNAYWVLGTRYWVLGTGYSVLGTGYWVLGTGYWVLGTGYWVLGTGYWVLGTVGCKLDLDRKYLTFLHFHISAFPHLTCYIIFAYMIQFNIKISSGI